MLITNRGDRDESNIVLKADAKMNVIKPEKNTKSQNDK